MKVLFIGDIVGKIGRNAVKALLPNLIDKYKLDLVIANGENIAGGFGLTEALVTELFKMGVHVITTGNHVWDKKDFVNYISKDNRVLRPLNYPPGVPGYGSVIYTLPDGMKAGIYKPLRQGLHAQHGLPFQDSKTRDRVLKKRDRYHNHRSSCRGDLGKNRLRLLCRRQGKRCHRNSYACADCR